MKQTVGIVLGFFAIVCGVFSVVALATTAWLHVSFRQLDYGLWSACTPLQCFSLGNLVTAGLQAVRAFVILGLLAQVSALICCILVVVKSTQNAGYGACGSFAAAGLFLLIAMALYTADGAATTPGISYGYSFGLGWASCGLSIIFSVVAGIQAKCTD